MVCRNLTNVHSFDPGAARLLAAIAAIEVPPFLDELHDAVDELAAAIDWNCGAEQAELLMASAVIELHRRRLAASRGQT